jgi:hypothetical protein
MDVDGHIIPLRMDAAPGSRGLYAHKQSRACRNFAHPNAVIWRTLAMRAKDGWHHDRSGFLEAADRHPGEGAHATVMQARLEMDAV